MLNAATGPTGIFSFKNLDMDLAPRYFEVNAIGPMKVAQAFYENVQASRMKQIYAMSATRDHSLPVPNFPSCGITKRPIWAEEGEKSIRSSEAPLQRRLAKTA